MLSRNDFSLTVHPRPRHTLRALLLGSLVTLTPQIIFAQTPSGAPSATANNLQDVVITARHRTERVQSVPVAVTVIDKKQLQNLGSINLDKIKVLVPSLTINSFNPRNTGLDIRGLGSNGFNGYDGLEAGVPIYVDGVLLGRSTESNFNIPNIADIEVLRGPQGTLFGKNSVDGALVVTTTPPSFTPEADLSASYGNYNYWALQGYATSALAGSDKLAASIALQAEQHNGYEKNTYNGQGSDNLDDKGVAAQFLAEPNSRLTIRVTLDYDHRDENCCINSPVGVLTNYANGAPVAINAPAYFQKVLGYKLAPFDPFNRLLNYNSWDHYAIESTNLAVHADYDLGAGYTISSITAGGYYNWYPHLDGDSLGFNALTAGNNTTHGRQFSQEFRFISPLGGAVDYTSGLYFFYQQLNDQARTQYAADYAALKAGTDNPASSAYENDLSIYNNFATAATDIPETYSGAFYGQATWHITPKLDLTGGGRFTYEDKTGVYYVGEETNQLDQDSADQGGYPENTYPGTTISAATIQADRNTITTGVATQSTLGFHIQHSDILPGGLITLSYKLEPNILTYVTYSHGEKSAGFNFTYAKIPLLVAPEKDDNYEVGVKTTLAGGRLLLDGDAFWDEDTDFQTLTTQLQSNGLYTQVLANVPKVRTRGFETDDHAQLTDNLSAFFSGAYTDAYYESDPNGVCPVELSNLYSHCNLTGRPIAANSTWVGSFGGEYDIPLPNWRGHDTQAYFGGNYLLKSGFYSTGDDSKYGYVPGYGLGNLSFGVREDDGGWDLSGWIHNFTNHNYYIYRTITTATSAPAYNLITGQVGDPLTFGVTLRTKFN